MVVHIYIFCHTLTIAEEKKRKKNNHLILIRQNISYFKFIACKKDNSCKKNKKKTSGKANVAKLH